MNTDRLLSLAISDTGFIFDPNTGFPFNANSTGIEIIKYLKENKDISEIIDIFLEEYDISKKDELESDIMDFVQHLKNYYLIT
ncbi:MAG: PqqD family protein [Desulfobacterales bacterium]|nr:PqqD family protein [Desulfobacterales bacterium]MBF0398759.1 PqqD family protein [Desulfobacterales bacterium]